MEVTKELRDKIHESVMLALDAYAAEEDVDIHIVDAVEAVLQEIVAEKVITTPGLVPVKYVGHRERYSDGNWDTGWWDQGQTKMVVESVASKMLVHTGVYTLGEPVSEVVPHEELSQIFDDPIQSARDAVMNMNRKSAVIEFVKANYRMEIPASHSGKLNDMRSFAIQQMDIYGLP